MEPLVLMSGVKPNEFDAVLKDLAKSSDDEVEDLRNWMVRTLQGPHADALAVYQLREPQYWVNLKMLAGKSLREQDSLKAALSHLRKSWRRRSGKAKAAVNVVDSGVAEGERGESTVRYGDEDHCGDGES